MKNILVVTGSGHATSCEIADKLSEELNRRGVAEEVNIGVVEYEKLEEEVHADDLLVATVLPEQKCAVKVFDAFPFLTGIRMEQEMDKILCCL
jgi:galactitol-specific phosphotransferase system IIB component